MYELDGEEVTLEFLQGKAEEYDMDFDSYLETMKKKGLVEKKEDVAEKGALVTSETTAPESGVSTSEDFSLGLKQKLDKRENYEGTSFTKGIYNVNLYKVGQDIEFKESLDIQEPTSELVDATKALTSTSTFDVLQKTNKFISLYNEGNTDEAKSFIENIEDTDKKDLVIDELKRKGFSLVGFEGVKLDEATITAEKEYDVGTLEDIIKNNIASVDEDSDIVKRAWGKNYFKLDEFPAWQKRNKPPVGDRLFNPETNTFFEPKKINDEDLEEYIKEQGGEEAWEIYKQFDKELERDFTGDINLKELLKNEKISFESVNKVLKDAKFEQAQIQVNKTIDQLDAFGRDDELSQLQLLRQIQVAGNDVGEAVYRRAFDDIYKKLGTPTIAAAFKNTTIDFNEKSAKDFIKIYQFAKAQGVVKPGNEFYYETAPGFIVSKIAEVKASKLNTALKAINNEETRLENESSIIKENMSVIINTQKKLLDQIETLGEIENISYADRIKRNKLIGEFQANQKLLETSKSNDIADLFNNRIANIELEAEVYNAQFDQNVINEEAYLQALSKNYNNYERAIVSLEETILGGYETIAARFPRIIDELLPEVETGDASKAGPGFFTNLLGIPEKETFDRLIALSDSKQQAFANKILYSKENLVQSIGMGMADNASTYFNAILMITPLSPVAYANYFAQGFGGSILQQEREMRNAISLIPDLQNKIIGTTNEDELEKLNEELERQQDILNTPFYLQNGAGIISGFADMFMERLFGQGLVARNFAKWSKVGANATFLQKAAGNSKAFGLSIVTEFPEEFSVQLINNGTNRVLLDRDVSLTDGVDMQFFGDVALGASGMSIMGTARNSFNGIRNTFATYKDKQSFKIKLSSVAKLNEQLKSPNLTKDKKRELLKLKTKKIKEMFFDAARITQKAESLTVDQLQEVFELDRKRHNAKKEILKAATSGEYGLNMSNIDKSILEDAQKQYDDFNEKIQSIVGIETKKHEQEAGKAIKDPNRKNTKSESELIYLQAIASFSNSAAKALAKKKGTSYTEITADKINDEFFAKVKKDNNLSDEDLAEFKQKAFSDNAVFIDDGKNGSVYIFTDNQKVNILLGTSLDGKIAAVAGVHELFHKENRDQGLIKNGEVIEAAKKGILGLDALMKIKLKNKQITKEVYDFYVKRKKAYNDDIDNNGVNYEEMLNLVGDLTTIGAVKRNDFNMLFGIKNFLNKTISMTPLGKKLNNFIDFSDNDNVFSYISSFNKAAYEGRILRGGVTREEDIVDIKASKEASDAVQKIYEQQGEAGLFDILEQFKPITTRIARRFRDVPGYDEQLLIDEIETGKRGILDLIREYKPESGVPLAAYINKFLPARSIEAGNRILKTEFEADVTEARGVAAQETAEDAVVTPERKTKGQVIADKLKITDKVTKEVSKIPFDLENLINFKSVPNAVMNTVGELLGISPAKIKSKANLTKDEVASAQRWFNKNKQLVIDALPQGFDAEGQATGVPRTILQALYTQKETRAKTKAGLKGQVKRTNIKDSEFLALIDIIEGKPTRNRNTSARIIALADLFGKVITNQEIRKQNPKALKIRDGMSKIMFSKGITKSKESGDIDLNTIEGKEKQKAWLSKVGFKILPKSFWLQNGQLVGSGAVYKNVIINGKKVKEYKINEGERIAARKMLFANVGQLKDFIKEYEKNGGTFAPESDNVKAAIKRTTTYGKKTAKQVQDQINKNKDLFDRSDKGFIDIWMAIQKDIQDNPGNRKHWAALLEVTSTTQANWMRVASRLVGGNTLGLPNTEEHMYPATDFAQYLWVMAKQNLLSPRVMRKAMKSYTQISLPNIYDKLLKGKDFDYTETLPDKDFGFEKSIRLEVLAGIIPSWVRYINPNVNKQVHYIDGVKYKGMNPNVLPLDKGQTLAQEYGVDVDVKYRMNQDVISIQQDILFRLFTNQITKSEATTELNARIKGVEILQETKQVRDNKKSLSDSIIKARSSKVYSSKSVGMSTFDFDETLIIDGKNFVTATKDGQTIQIPSDKWPIDGPRYSEEGWSFDFSDFVNVRGGKEGPLLQKMKNQIKKYGNKNVFVLTARMQEAAEPIHQWLKSKGIDIPIENITGLGKSEGDAKAQWFVEKYAEGYNDMYFVDDALPNVEAVKNVFDQLDIKGKSVQARIKSSKGISIDFNKMLERTKGVGAEKIFSRIGAQKRGKNIGKFAFFVPPSADDFAGLLRYFAGKGKQGDADIAFFKKALIDPFARADEEMKRMRQTITDDYKALRKKFPKIKKKLGKMIGDSGFTFDNAIRVYLWDKAGFDIPGLSKRDIKLMVDTVNKDADLKTFADTVGLISKQKDGYIQPGEYWNVESIASDLMNVVNKVGRKQFLAEWIENKNEIFSKDNLNKIEAIYGSRFREALENMLWRMENGTNRPKGMGRLERAWTNWVNNSVGAIMFFNMRSAVLQTISSVNFINFEDNNVFAAAKAFANQKQYWKDFTFLFNSNFLKQRRAGLQLNVNEAELASAVAGATNKAKAAIAYLLKIGFLPTQIADSFAIASGGATFYRNRVNKYIKEGMNKADAEKQAMLDFMEIAEETQQSARPDRISQQQASGLGRLILAFANTPMQYNRLIKKAAGDLINKRGDWRSNVSRIIYYGAIQSFIFSALQSALFALAFDDEEDDEQLSQKAERTLNSMVDSLLRGSGLAGAVVAAVKNGILELREQNERGFRADYGYVLVELLNVSPPIGSKARKVYKGGFQTYKFNKDLMGEMNTFDLDNPVWDITGNLVSAATNLPLDRGFRKIDNISAALNQDNETWQRIAVALGWDQWSLGIETKYEKRDKLKEEIREKKKEEKKKNKQRCTKIKSDGERCKIMVNKPKTRCHYHD